jgi:hypothetical protein
MKYWIISQLDTAPSEDGLTDVVKTVHWRRQAQEVINEVTYNADVYGSMGCATPSETDFTAYPDLTEAQVCSWLEAGMDVESLDLNLDAQIENQVNPPIVNLPLPWTPTPVVEEVVETEEPTEEPIQP